MPQQAQNFDAAAMAGIIAQAVQQGIEAGRAQAPQPQKRLRSVRKPTPQSQPPLDHGQD
jgi:hypothetical protein